ncbi:metallophosphoesterase [Paraneptunicella aestuarii]|uniref:metallophosphoesterase family protein n=1 Tax=Paraneptunicella aestuarii TaxID=2831148 RepID=UPI001E54C031|nr:metallophosphoesterase [Paraneptunicella aestuarii]UAA37453.1 metallophosphoesterase [Paraneptunicella aestuarii]
MRVFVVSDVHIDYKENREWLLNLSAEEYVDDVLILAGDLTENLGMLRESFQSLQQKFKKVLFVPGNHELWVVRDKTEHSFQKYYDICEVAEETGVLMEPYHDGGVSIVPLLGWYDFSFAEPSKMLLDTWMDFRLCRWPDELGQEDITQFFIERNEPYLDVKNETVISFSHFLPRIDLMPPYIPQNYRFVYPALGSNMLEEQVRRLDPDIHVYGHSHVNRHVTIDGVKYINNAFGYPSEHNISMKELLCVYED